MKKILHVVHDSFALSHFLGNQFDFLRKNRFIPHLICSPGEAFDKFKKVNKLEDNSAEILIERKISPFRDLVAVVRISRYIKNNQIEVVIGHSPKGGLLAMLAAYIMRVPNRIFFRHGLVYETAKGSKRHLLVFIEKLTAFCATQVVCVSESVKTVSKRDSLGNSSKFKILSSGSCTGIDTQFRFNPSFIDKDKLSRYKCDYNFNENDFIIGYCGRLAPDKGIVELLNAFIRLSDISSKYKLLLVGDQDERTPLPSDVLTIIQNHPNVVLTGFVKNDIEYYYSMMDVFVLPSYREGFPISTLEASAMKCPILTTRATGCVDSIINGETGFFVNHNSNSIKEGILMLSDNLLKKQLGENARSFAVNKFDHLIVWKAFVELL